MPPLKGHRDTTTHISGWAFKSRRVLRLRVDYGAYEVMTTRVGERGEKIFELRKFDKPYHAKLGNGREYDEVQLWAGGSCADCYSSTVWKFLGIEVVDLVRDRNRANELDINHRKSTKEWSVGPFSNGYRKSFSCPSGKIYAVHLGNVLARHYTNTDTKTYIAKPNTKRGYDLKKNPDHKWATCEGCHIVLHPSSTSII